LLAASLQRLADFCVLRLLRFIFTLFVLLNAYDCRHVYSGINGAHNGGGEVGCRDVNDNDDGGDDRIACGGDGVCARVCCTVRVRVGGSNVNIDHSCVNVGVGVGG
jgi:hypothetical protein